MKQPITPEQLLAVLALEGELTIGSFKCLSWIREMLEDELSLSSLTLPELTLEDVKAAADELVEKHFAIIDGTVMVLTPKGEFENFKCHEKGIIEFFEDNDTTLEVAKEALSYGDTFYVDQVADLLKLWLEARKEVAK